MNDNQIEDKLTASGSEDSDDEGSQVNLISELVLPSCSSRAVHLLLDTSADSFIRDYCDRTWIFSQFWSQTSGTLLRTAHTKNNAYNDNYISIHTNVCSNVLFSVSACAADLSIAALNAQAC